MRVSDSLNLVLPFDGGYAFHTPINRETFEANYRLLAMARAELEAGGTQYQLSLGPKIAALTLRDKCTDVMGNTDRAEALFGEIKRLTMICAESGGLWKEQPVDAAIRDKVIDAEMWSDMLAQVVFFTCHYAFEAKARKATAADALASLLNASVTPLGFTEWKTSLMPSTPDGASVVTASSLPS